MRRRRSVIKGILFKTVLIFSVFVWFVGFGLAESSGNHCQLEGRRFKVVTTANWIAYLVERIGGKRVEIIKVLGSPKDDPHRILPRPSYLVAMRKADLLVYNGLFLESGYLPKLVENSRNPKIGPKALGNIELSAYLSTVLERAVNPSRQLVTADLHPYGNPHYHFDPRRVLEVSQGLYLRLSELDPSCREYYYENYREYRDLLEAKMRQWLRELEGIKGGEFIEYHKMFEYLADFAEFKIIGTVEPVPGLPPTAAHIEKLIRLIKERKPIGLLTTYYYEDASVRRIEELTGLPYVKLPHDIGTLPNISSYEQLMDSVVDSLVELYERR